MNSIKSVAAVLAVLALGSADIARAATKPMMMSTSDKTMMSTCVGMSHDAMMADKGCMSMMKKMKMSDSDMKMMMSCKSMSKDMMMKDEKCMSMMKMHPDLMNMSMSN